VSLVSGEHRWPDPEFSCLNDRVAAAGRPSLRRKVASFVINAVHYLRDMPRFSYFRVQHTTLRIGATVTARCLDSLLF
jgi:hypothetical protein